MFLFHNTSLEALELILKNECLKSLSLLKKEGTTNIIGEGSGIYTKNNFIYFSCSEKLFSKNTHAQIILYFNSKLLYKRQFYVSNAHSPVPNIEETWNDSNGNKHYKKKYNKYYKNYDKVLQKLFDYSISTYKKVFQVFQQIAIKNKVNLDDLIGIEFKFKKFATPKILKYIKDFYPNVKVKINENK